MPKCNLSSKLKVVTLINIGKVAAFINDVIIGTEMEDGHDEIVAEVVRRLEENDLYIKPEKCK